MILLYKSNVLTVYSVNSNTLIMNCHKLLCCNNFPTVPNRPYFNYHCTFYICMYIICMLYVLSVIKASSVFCMYGLELSQTSTGPDQLPSSALFQHMTCSLFVVGTSWIKLSVCSLSVSTCFNSLAAFP